MKMDKKNTASAVAKMFPVAMNLVSHSWIAVAVVLPVSVVLLYASACMARAKHSSHARIRAGGVIGPSYIPSTAFLVGVL